MKVLILRLSSFGDVVQVMRLPPSLMQSGLASEVHWLVRSDFKDLLEGHPSIQKVYSIPRKSGLKELWRLSRTLKKENYDLIYDAHNNLRTLLLKLFLFPSKKWITRSKFRLRRFFLFQLRKNLFPWPFVAQKSYLEPLSSLGLKYTEGNAFHLKAPLPDLDPNYRHICAVSSAAWVNKRWPIEYWDQLLECLADQKIHWHFLGGKEDTFIEDIVQRHPLVRVTNYAGKLSLQESSAYIQASDLVLANDTGLLHVADQMEKPLLAFIGPTAFGYPMNKNAKILETSLTCKPCSKDGRDKCKNAVYQKCMKEITPQLVESEIRRALHL